VNRILRLRLDAVKYVSNIYKDFVTLKLTLEQSGIDK